MFLKFEHTVKHPYYVTLIESGRNNKVFKLQNEKNTFLMKFYFHHEGDTRDRLGNEFSFISFAWNHGIHTVPRPVEMNRSEHTALYEFIEGKKITADELVPEYIEQAINFCLALNKIKKKTEAEVLSIASESCFSINEHISCVSRRIKRLSEIEGTDDINQEAIKFVHNELLPIWLKIKDKTEKQAKASGFDLNQYIVTEEKCLSPSDFGFHNAILEKNNKFRFIDFEYAGWDDPAKLVCDFFCQPEIPVPLKYFSMFQNAIAAEFPKSEELCKRIEILFPVYRLKWCCIMMNEFLPVGIARRNFAEKSDDNTRKKRQLEKVYSYFSHFKQNLM